MEPGPLALGPYAAHGRGFSLRVADRRGVLGPLLERLLAPLQSDEVAASHRQFVVTAPDGTVPGTVVEAGITSVSTIRREQLLTQLLRRVNQHVLGDLDDRVVLHAGAVARDGGAVLLPADMEAGKTTLVAGLLLQGWSYLSDEAPGVTADHLAVPFPKPLSIDPGSWEVLEALRPDGPAAAAGWFREQWQVVPERIEPAPVPIRFLVFPRYEADSVTAATRLTPGEAAERAIACTFVTGRRHIPTTTVRRLAAVCSGVPAWQLAVGSLDAACDVIDGLWHEAGG